LHLYDYCQTIGGACVVIVTTAERARNGPHKPVYLMGMQGMCAGREEATGARPGLGINQQDEGYPVPHPRDMEIYRMAGVNHEDIDAFYTYDAMSSIVWMALERFGFCKPGEAWQFVKDGHIRPGGSLPVNTHGGLLSEVHVSGWNHIIEMVRQLRGECGARQVPDAELLQGRLPECVPLRPLVMPPPLHAPHCTLAARSPRRPLSVAQRSICELAAT
jgi:acetyl-CoA acetyltransferase